MTYREIRTWLLDEASQDSGGDFATILNTAINLTYRRLLSEVGQEYQDRVYTVASVVDRATYGLNLYVNRILNVEDTANDKALEEVFRDQYDKAYPDTTTSGTSRNYFIKGRYGVQTQPAAASTITVESSSTADNTNRFVRITGLVSSVQRTEQLTLTGTTVVTSTLTYDASGIERITKSTNDGFSIAGNVIIKAGSTTLATIPPGITSPSYLWIQFYPIPSAVVTYNIRCESRKPNLVNDDDWPEIDEDFHDLILYGAAADTFSLVGKQDVADRMKAYYEQRLKVYKSNSQKKPNLIRQFVDLPITYSIPRRPRIENIDF